MKDSIYYTRPKSITFMTTNELFYREIPTFDRSRTGLYFKEQDYKERGLYIKDV